jgi:hypothetical protein
MAMHLSRYFGFQSKNSSMEENAAPTAPIRLFQKNQVYKNTYKRAHKTLDM